MLSFNVGSFRKSDWHNQDDANWKRISELTELLQFLHWYKIVFKSLQKGGVLFKCTSENLDIGFHLLQKAILFGR